MNKTKFYLLVANLALAVYIFFDFKKSENSTQDISSVILETLQSLEKIEIKSDSDAEKLSIKKSNDLWMIQSPIHWITESLVISNLCTKLAHSNPSKVIGIENLIQRGELLTDYGIDDNSSRILIEGNGNGIEFVLGSQTRDNEKIYVLIDHDGESFERAVWKISKDIADLASSDPIFWSESTFLDTPLYGIDEVLVSGPQENRGAFATNLKKIAGKWHFSDTLEPANNESVNLTLNKILSTRLEDFPEDQNATDESDPILILQIKGMGDSEVIEVRSGEKSKFVECRKVDSNLNFLVNQDFTDLLSDWRNKFRDTTIFRKERSNIRTITYKSTHVDFKLLRKSIDGWIVFNDLNQTAKHHQGDLKIINDFIDGCYKIRIEQLIAGNSIVAFKEITEDNPKIELTFEYSDQSKSSIWIDEDKIAENFNRSFILDSSQYAIINVPEENIFIKNKNFFREKALLSLTSDAFSIEISTLDANASGQRIKLSHAAASSLPITLSVNDYLESSYDSLGFWHGGDWIPWHYEFKILNDGNMTLFDAKIAEDKEVGKLFGGQSDDNQTFIFNEDSAFWIKNFLKQGSSALEKEVR